MSEWVNEGHNEDDGVSVEYETWIPKQLSKRNFVELWGVG